MSSFLSAIHYQLYDKMKYQEHLCKSLHTLLQEEQLKMQPFVNILPNKDLQECIDHNQIHAWLQEYITKLDIYMSHLLTQLQSGKRLEKAQQLCFNEGTHISVKEYANCKELFQHIQKFNFVGMPCDKGILLDVQEPSMLVFQINVDIYHHILDIDSYMKLRLAWMRGIINKSNFTIAKTGVSTFTITQEDAACTTL